MAGSGVWLQSCGSARTYLHTIHRPSGVKCLPVLRFGEADYLPAPRCFRGSALCVECVNKAERCGSDVLQMSLPSGSCDCTGKPRVVWLDSPTWSHCHPPSARQRDWKKRQGNRCIVGGELRSSHEHGSLFRERLLYLLLVRTPTESEAKALTASVSSQSLLWAAR